MSRSKRNRPLVFVFNNVHHFRRTEEGRNILLQLQQRAETWAENRKLMHMYILTPSGILSSPQES